MADLGAERRAREQSEVKADTERRESAERKDRQQGQLLQAQRLESLGQLAGGHTTDGAN